MQKPQPKKQGLWSVQFTSQPPGSKKGLEGKPTPGRVGIKPQAGRSCRKRFPSLHVHGHGKQTLPAWAREQMKPADHERARQGEDQTPYSAQILKQRLQVPNGPPLPLNQAHPGAEKQPRVAAGETVRLAKEATGIRNLKRACN